MRSRLPPTWPDAASDSDSPVVLLLHGFGSNEFDLPGLAPWLPEGVLWASLRGPIDMEGGGAAWFPLELSIEPNQALLMPDQAPIDTATEALWEWVEAHVPANAPIVPLGFSQGGFMALQLLRTRPERVAATVVLSGFTTPADQPADTALTASRPPVFWGRGDEDTLIWGEEVERLAAWLTGHANLTARVYSGLGHGVSDEEMTDVRSFLSAQLWPPRA